MFIRKVKFSGFGGALRPIEVEFTPTGNYKDNEDAVETFGLERNIKEFSALKQVFLIGKNSVGKSTMLEGILSGLQLLFDPMMSFHPLDMAQKLNVFSRDKILRFELEFSVANTNKKYLATKYKIKYEFDSIRRVFLSEEINFWRATKSSISKKQTLYKNKGGNAEFINGEKMLIPSGYSCFSLVRGTFSSGTLKELLEEHIELFFDAQVKLTRGEMPIGIVPSIVTPNWKTGMDFFQSAMKTLDSSIVGVVNQRGVLFLQIETANGIENVTIDNMFLRLSSGTKKSFNILVNILLSTREKGVGMYDEIDLSVHSAIFDLYISLLKATGKQSIIATHSEIIFERPFIRTDQIINIKKEKGVITTKQLSEDIDDKRSIGIKKIRRVLRNDPSPEVVMELLDMMDKK